MTCKPFTPPESITGVSYVKMPTELLEALQTCETKGQYDALCGACVRYSLTLQPEEVPKSIAMTYRAVQPIMNRIVDGMLTGGIRHSTSPTSGSEVNDSTDTNDDNGDTDREQVDDLSETSTATSYPPSSMSPAETTINPARVPTTPNSTQTQTHTQTAEKEKGSGKPERHGLDSLEPYNRPLKPLPTEQMIGLIEEYACSHSLETVTSIDDALVDWAMGWIENGWCDKNGRSMDSLIKGRPRWQAMLDGYDETMRRNTGFYD